MSETVFLGIDGEMTGGQIQPPGMKPNFQKYQLCQIGMALLEENVREKHPPVPQWFLATIGYDQIEQEPEAMAVHGVSEAQIKAAARPAEVDALAVKWLDERGIRKATPVGYSVGSFDAPYIREYLPNLARRISMRALDLNAVVFTISAITGRSYKNVKAAGKNYAEKMIRANTSYTEAKPHEASYDALVATYSWEYFKSILVMREIHEHF
jgi:hypothetical protein